MMKFVNNSMSAVGEKKRENYSKETRNQSKFHEFCLNLIFFHMFVVENSMNFCKFYVFVIQQND